MLKERTKPKARRSTARRKPTLAAMVRTLRAHMPELSERYGVRSLGIFGSYLRGDQKSRSDLDVLVEFDEHMGTYKNWVALESELTETFGVKVDVVPNENLKPFIGKRIQSEVVWLRRDGKDLPVRLSRRKKGIPHMAAKREYLDFLNDMVTAMDQTQRIIANVTFDELALDETRVLALAKAVENIGEAAKHIPADVRSRYPNINWKDMAGMRDHLAHGYFQIKIVTLWETVTQKIPDVKPLVAAALEQELQRRADRDKQTTNGKKNGEKK
jgi:uncharacterized protein with HEPN domain/predicted nucleotidyltransferase